ncbi:hypothetical protein ACIA6D_20980 [Streptomyces cacaoi]
MIETVEAAMHQDFHKVRHGTAPRPGPPGQLTVIVDEEDRPLALVGDERRWPAVLVHPDTTLAEVLADDWLMDLVLQGLPAVLGWSDDALAGLVPAGALLDKVASAYNGPAAAVTNPLGQPLDVELPGDPSPAPAALVMCCTCGALNRVDKASPAEPPCRNGHRLDPDFG